jgi:hypothetical protein
VIAIVDHTKWERAAFATFCPTDRIGLVLTDSAAPTAMVDELRRGDVDVRLVGPAAPLAGDDGVAADGPRRSTRASS